MRVKLQSWTMTQLQTDIATSSLSQTFQDAINIVHSLGVDYLWIDALCIVQDKNELDWEIESQKMDKIYSNGHINISATMSSTGNEPLFRERCLGSMEPSKINLFGSVENNYWIIDAQIWKDEIDDAVLNQRGWVSQERFSSCRILTLVHGS